MNIHYKDRIELGQSQKNDGISVLKCLLNYG